MEPVLSPEAMAVVDAASGPVDVLIRRAGWQVARWARQEMGGTYGRRVVVVAGKGNNGADGRIAAEVLSAWGARVVVVDPRAADLPTADLIIDAAFGTGLRGRWDAPDATADVLAVDLPSGLDPRDGADHGGFAAATTVTFGALKPGLLFGHGPSRAGQVRVEPIGLALDAVDIDTWRWDDGSCAPDLPVRGAEDHKWTRAVRVIAGSDGMEGAPRLATAAALAAGAGMVVVSRPDGGRVSRLPTSAVERIVGAGDTQQASDWVGELLADIERFSSVVIGPGLGRDSAMAAQIRRFVAECPVPVVVDADAVHAVAEDVSCLVGRGSATVLTPHDGEFASLASTSVDSADRIASTRSVAATSTAIVLRKGPATVVSDGRRSAVVTSGDARLATAGTGDVLSGMIAAMELSADPWRAAATAAHWHGVAAHQCPRHGVTAPDLVDAIGSAREHLGSGSGE